MYVLTKLKDNGSQRRNKYHEVDVPLIFVVLWVAGLALTIINPQLPYIDANTPSAAILSSLVCIYFVFIIEVFVTFTDINCVFHPYKAKTYLWKIVLMEILPNIALTVGAFIWYYHHQKVYWLLPFVALSAIIKWREVWLANNGEKIFVESNKDVPQNNILTPKTIIK